MDYNVAYVGGYGADLIGYGSTTAADTALDAEFAAFGVGTAATNNNLAAGNDASYTNQFVNGQQANQSVDGQQLLAANNVGTVAGEYVPDTRYELPPLEATAGGGAETLPAAGTQAQATTAAATAATTAAAVVEQPKPKPLVVTVKKGDSLSKIAAKYDLTWQDLYKVAANKKVVGSDPNLIHPGQKLQIPGHTVPGDPVKAEATPTTGGGPAATATTANATPEVKELLKQLTDIDKKIATGQDLLTQFYAQLQYAQTQENVDTINDSIELTMQDNGELQRIRDMIIQQLGPNAPTTSDYETFLQSGLGSTI